MDDDCAVDATCIILSRQRDHRIQGDRDVSPSDGQARLNERLPSPRLGQGGVANEKSEAVGTESV